VRVDVRRIGAKRSGNVLAGRAEIPGRECGHAGFEEGLSRCASGVGHGHSLCSFGGVSQA
jgi:hypothetical protein